MITIGDPIRIGRCTIYRDDVDPLHHYLIPESPRIALDEDGKPIFSLAWYRRDVSKLTDEERRTKLGGGILAASVELAATEEELKEIKATLAKDPVLQARTGRAEDELVDALKIGPLPILDGTVSIAVLAETTGEAGRLGELVSSLVGVGRVSMLGAERASFMAKLTQDGAVLLWEMLEKNLPAIRVAYDLKFNHRLNGVRMDVWCHARKAFEALQEQERNLTDDAHWSVTHEGGGTHYRYGEDQSDTARDRIFSAITAYEASGVTITPEAASDVIKPELIAELTQQGNEMIKDFLASTFLEAKVGEDFSAEQEPDLKTELATQDGKRYGHHGIHQYRRKDWDESMQADLHYSYKSKAVLEAHVGPNDNLGNVLAGRQVTELRTQIDIDAAFYKYLDVQVLCTANFDDDPVDLVKVHLAYDGRGEQGEIHAVKDFVFRKDTPPQRFSTYLGAPDQLTYSYEYEVLYKDSSDRYKTSGRGKETILVLDADRLGVLRVDVQMGIVDWDRIRQAIVKLSYGSGQGAKEREVVLDAQHQTGRWTEVIGRPVTEPYTAQITFVDKNQQRIELEPRTSRARTLVVDQPLQEELDVLLVAAGSFGAGGLISQIAVALRYRDDANDYSQSDVFNLTKEGDSKVWKVPLLDKTLKRFEYRVTVLYSDGITREDDWRATENPVLPVGDPFGFRVQILPYLLKGPTWAFGTIALRFDDAAGGIHADRTLELKDFATPLTWRFRLAAPERHSYRYQVTLYRAADGKEVQLPEVQETKEVLVLVPPAQV